MTENNNVEVLNINEKKENEFDESKIWKIRKKKKKKNIIKSKF